MARTAKQIADEMRTLAVSNSVPPIQAVEGSGWYECTDGTYRKIQWIKGGPNTVAHVRDAAAVEAWDRLDAEGAVVSDREYYAAKDARQGREDT